MSGGGGGAPTGAHMPGYGYNSVRTTTTGSRLQLAARRRMAQRGNRPVHAPIQTVGGQYGTNTMDQIDIRNPGAAPAYTGPAAPGSPPPPAAPPAPRPTSGGAYATPNYAQQGQDAIARVNPIYDNLAKYVGNINQQQQQASAYNDQSIKDSGAARFAEMQQQLGQGYQDDSTRANAAYQLDSLRNSGLAQDEYSRRMGQMLQLDASNGLADVERARAQSLLGINSDVAAARAAAASGGSGGGGGVTASGEPTSAELKAVRERMQWGQPSMSALDWLNKQGAPRDKDYILRDIYARLRKSKGKGVNQLIGEFGGMKADPKNPKQRLPKYRRAMDLLTAFKAQREKHLNPAGPTYDDVYNQWKLENGG
jgi:hypothetical protein